MRLRIAGDDGRAARRDRKRYVLLLGERRVEFGDAFDDTAQIDWRHGFARHAGFGFGDQQERIEGGDQLIGFAHRGFDFVRLPASAVDCGQERPPACCAID